MSNRTHLLGVGFDNTDGHKRITKAEDATIVGGSAETHERMAETYIKTSEELKRRGKNLQNVGSEELRDIMRNVTPR